MRIIWTIQAQEDLEALYRYWLTVNAGYAAQLYNQLIDETEVLRTFPRVGALERLLKHCPEGYRSLLSGKRHKLIYTIEDDDIVIHAVWDCRQDPDTLKDSV